MKYGPKWKEFNKWFQENKHLLKCEYCPNPAGVVHHIIRAGGGLIHRSHDNPHFWIILCLSCHAYTQFCMQPFEEQRIEEWSKTIAVLPS